MRRIKIFDTTLRDGEQSPGIALRPDEKAEIARALELLGVDIVEAGFAASSPGDFQGVAAVVDSVTRATVASLAERPKATSTPLPRRSAGAPRSRIHVFIATSALHMERKLGLTPPQVLERISWAVAYAAERADEVEFSAEDATGPTARSSRERAARRSLQGDDRQPAGHRRLYDARRVRPDVRRPARALPRARRGLLGALP